MISRLPDVFNVPEVRALMRDLDLVPLDCFRSAYLFPYMHLYPHVYKSDSDKQAKFCDWSDSFVCGPLW